VRSAAVVAGFEIADRSEKRTESKTCRAEVAIDACQGPDNEMTAAALMYDSLEEGYPLRQDRTSLVVARTVAVAGPDVAVAVAVGGVAEVAVVERPRP